MFDDRSLALTGFQGFTTWSEFRPPDVTSSPGIYVVVRNGHVPSFVAEGSGGRFKGRDPNVTIDVLAAKWVDPADVVYIGRATCLRSRLRQYRDFGSGKAVGHWGGRYIWQLQQAHELKVGWRASSEPVHDESALLRAFVDTHSALPFANLRF